MEFDPDLLPQLLDDNGNVTQEGQRVLSVKLADDTFIVEDGDVVGSAPSVNIAIVDFLARGGDQYPFRDAPFISLGVSYQQALRNYIQDGLGGDITDIDYPEDGEDRITELP
jgi:5'-nucleotidase